MQDWVISSLILIISSIGLYLFIRKAKNLNISIDIQNLAMFMPPAIIMGIYNLLLGKSFNIELFPLIIIIFSSFVFSFLGNKASLKALIYAPNPGYSLIISKSYVLLTTIIAVFLFNSTLTTKSVISILLIILFSSLIVIDKNNKKDSNKIWIPLTLFSFFAWGFLSLTLKYLTSLGLDSTIILFYLMSFVSIFITLDTIIKHKALLINRNIILMFFLIGISSTIFNLSNLIGISQAPNPGYINAANAGSIALVTVFSSIIFKDELKLRKIIGVLGVVISLLFLFI